MLTGTLGGKIRPKILKSFTPFGHLSGGFQANSAEFEGQLTHSHRPKDGWLALHASSRQILFGLAKRPHSRPGFATHSRDASALHGNPRAPQLRAQESYTLY